MRQDTFAIPMNFLIEDALRFVRGRFRVVSETAPSLGERFEDGEIAGTGVGLDGMGGDMFVHIGAQ